ncbi:MAG TPA: RNA polymerase sigma factor [Solirubrobacterales bacterium]|nr:RNA polymerase sigma factor [Solirubrobacterales bacterium]
MEATLNLVALLSVTQYDRSSDLQDQSMPPPPAELFASRVFLGPALRAQPDRRLVELVRDGYDAAFEEIVRRYRKPLDRFAAGIVGGRSEDVTQDAFSKALRALRGSEAEIELRPWLYRVVRNTALNDLRDRAPAAEELSERTPGARSAAAEVESREELRDLMERLGALPEPQRAALVMRELEGLGHEEIAAALGVSGGAARQAIYRARAALREGMGLLIPLPVLRTLSEHGGEMAAGGLGVGALKVGVATVLIAGTVGAGVAIEHRRGDRPGPEAAEAAPLVAGKQGQARSEASTADSGSSADKSRGAGGENGSGDSGQRGGHGGSGSLDDGTGAQSGSGGSGGGPGPSGSRGGSVRSGSEESGGSGGDDSSGSGDRHGGGGGDGGSSDGSSGGSGDGGGISGGSGSNDVSSGDGGSSGSGSGDVESDPTSEPALSESSDGGDSTSTDGSGSDVASSGSSGDGSTSTTTLSSSESDGSP